MYDILDQEVNLIVMEELRQRRGLNEDDTVEDEDILTMSGFDFFNEWLGWHGIVGWTGEILDVIRMAYGVDFTDNAFNEPINRTVEDW